MRTFLVFNPNTSASVTQSLAAEAARVAGGRATIRAITAPRGVPGIQTLDQLAAAEETVVEALESNRDCDGAIVAAFGDPGLQQARARVSFPVAGLAESGMLAAARGGRRFAIVTAGQAMRTAIEQKIEMLGLRSQLAELRFIDRPISDVIGDRASLLPAIIAAINDCFRQSDAQAVLLGGGPMVGAAREIAAQCDGPVIDGMEAAVEQLLGRIGAA